MYFAHCTENYSLLFVRMIKKAAFLRSVKGSIVSIRRMLTVMNFIQFFPCGQPKLTFLSLRNGHLIHSPDSFSHKFLREKTEQNVSLKASVYGP